MKQPQFYTLHLEKIVGGGQALGTLDDGRKAFVWGGLPDETVTIRVTKKKSKFVEGIVTEVRTPSPHRIAPRDPSNYLSTSPWQIMNFDTEQHYKAALIEEAFELHDIVLPDAIDVYADDAAFEYRNKVEFSWYSEAKSVIEVTSAQTREASSSASLRGEDCLSVVSSAAAKEADGGASRRAEAVTESTDFAFNDTLDLAFYRRGSKGKITVDGTSLARPEINQLARAIRDLLRTKPVSARNLKTLLIRADQQGICVWQLYLKDEITNLITSEEANTLPAQGGEIIYSNPKSPASVITKRLAAFGDVTLNDTILGVPFNYACEGFFQVNIPVYEQALKDMQRWVELDSEAAAASAQSQSTSSSACQSKETSDREDFAFPAKRGQERQLDQLAAERSERTDGFRCEPTTLDLYSGVGTIGLTIGGDNVTLVEINEHAVREMRRNIAQLGKNAQAVLAPSEQALDYITPDKTIIVDPPRAGLHADVVSRLLDQLPPRIIYLSCNPVTQARDVAFLLEKYHIVHHRGYNFFPSTPHIEHLIILDRSPASNP